MTHRPRTRDEIYEELKSNLTGKIARLTNFTERSFNYIWNQAFADELQRLEVLSLSTELAGWIDYAGGPITQGDLEELGVEESVDLDELNELVSDDQLDRLVEIVGIERFEGAKATGNVTITTQSDQTDIDKGTVVTTSPDGDGETLRFKTTEDVSTADGVTSVSDVSIEAFEVGEEHNVPGGTANTASIVRFESPPLGVRGVYNANATTGGEGRESNEDLRERAKGAVAGASEGGTVKGIETFIRQDIDVVREGDIIIEEFTDPCPPYVDVIVDGGNESDVLDAIDESRPAGIRHNLIRPQIIQVGANIDLLGQDISTASVETVTEDYLLELGLGENLYRDDLIRQIMVRDDDILNIDFLDLTINNVRNERFTFSTEIDAAIADDGGTFSNETVEANNDAENDMTLLPQSPSTGDAYYFGSSLPFTEFDLHISTAGSGTWDIVWEYYDGSSWTGLSNVTDDTNDFQTGGRNTVTWDVPSDWQKADVDGNVNYFVRARLDTFSSLSVQPLAAQAFITGGSYRLDYTYDETNGGSITIEDSDGTTYTKGPSNDYTVEDQSGDGWPETILWHGGAKPDDGQTFSVDYDVTIDATPEKDRYYGRLVRDETNTFEEGNQQTFTYTGADQYQLDETPFDDGTVSVSDADGNNYTEGATDDYEIVSTGRADETDDFTYSSGKTTYYLEAGADETTVRIEDENGTTYDRQGTDPDPDFQLTDTDSDGIEDAVDWSIGGGNPSDGTDFTVEYKRDNGYPATIDWSVGGGNPTTNVDFTVTYNKKVYETKHEIVETPAGELDDNSGDTYQENTDYNIIDHDFDAEDDAVSWISNPSTLDNGEEFYITYNTEGDLLFGSREKADPGPIDIEVNNG